MTEEVEVSVEEMGTSELEEIIAGLELLLVNGAKASKDGIGFDDFQYAVDIIKNYKVLVDAVEGIDDALLEIKNLDQMETIALVTRLFSLFKTVKAALK